MAPKKGSLRALFAPSCTGCKDLEKSVDALLADGERYASAPLRIDFTSVLKSSQGAARTAISAGLTSRAVAILNSRGVPVQKFTTESGEWEFQLEWSGAWQVADVRRVQ